MPRPRTTALAGLLVPGALVAGVLAPARAVAATEHARPQHGFARAHHVGVASPTTTPSSVIDVVVPLHPAPAARSALRQLAHATVGATTRAARLRALAPGASKAATVRSWAAERGFEVTSTSSWAVGLRGRADRLSAAFGTSLGTSTLHGKGFVRPRTAVLVPAALAGVAEPAVGLDTRPLFRSRSVYGGGDVQVVNSVPLRGSGAGAGSTVATVNLSGWHPNDLTVYRKAAFGGSGTNPGRTAVLVGSRTSEIATPLEDYYGDEVEVALDAEAIAGVAPAAKQRMYFGGNSAADYVAILERMATDLELTPGAFQTASTSWGLCEPFNDDSAMTAMRDAITRITAAGGTFFAASGDSGAFGCSDGASAGDPPAVDFPASAEDAVAVGGTTVSGAAPSYSSSAWTGSGGGCSGSVPAPTRQATTGAPCLHRAVPDIAALADPDPGFFVYDQVGQWMPMGGTSLAAPVSAAGLADVMAHANLTGLSPSFLDTAYAHPSAFTDITAGNNGLYKAAPGYDLVTGLGSPRWTELEAAITGNPAPTPTGSNEPLLAADPTPQPLTAFLDVELGSTVLPGILPNGEDVDGYAANGLGASDCSSPSATPPSTTSIGGAEGTVQVSLSLHTAAGGCITVQRPVVVDSKAPVVPVPVVTYVGTTSPAYRFSWAAPADPAPSAGVLFYELDVYDLTTGQYVGGWQSTGRAAPFPTTAAFKAVAGHSYRAELYAVDGAYNVGSRTAGFVAPFDDTRATLSKHLSGSTYVSDWVRAKSTADYLGSHLSSGRKGAAFAFGFTGKTATIGVLKSVYGGYADVYVDGVKKARVSLYASKTLFRQQVRVATFSTSGKHTVKVVVVGAHTSAAKANLVYLDSITVGV